jgi:hypothetical protein
MGCALHGHSDTHSASVCSWYTAPVTIEYVLIMINEKLKEMICHFQIFGCERLCTLRLLLLHIWYCARCRTMQHELSRQVRETVETPQRAAALDLLDDMKPQFTKTSR